MNYRYEMTEKEKAYLAYFTRRGMVSDGLWLGYKIVTLFIMAVVILFAIVSLVKTGNLEGVWMIALCFFGLIIFFWLVIFFRIKWDKSRIAPIYNGNYSAVRTKIKNKELLDYGVKIGRRYSTVWYCAYFCEGISEPVSPPTEKFYKLANEGDNIIVVMAEAKNIYLGFVFNEQIEKIYDKKVMAYYNKRKNTNQKIKEDIW